MFVRALLSFYPARCLASREFSLNSIIPTRLSRAPFERDARPSCNSNHSRTYRIPGGGEIYRFSCQTNSPRPAPETPLSAFFHFTHLRTLSFSLAHLSTVSPALSALFPKKQGGTPDWSYQLLPSGSGLQNPPARRGERPLRGSCSTNRQLALSGARFLRPACFTGAEGSPITSHSSPVAGHWPLLLLYFPSRGEPPMIPMTPEQAAFLLQYQLPSVKNEYRTTSGIIAAIPAANADYRPDPYAKTAVELAWHVVAAEHRFYGGIVAGVFDFNAIPRPEGGITKENILK